MATFLFNFFYIILVLTLCVIGQLLYDNYFSLYEEYEEEQDNKPVAWTVHIDKNGQWRQE